MRPRLPDPPSLVHALLELTVVGSFSRMGPVVRRRLERWPPPHSDVLAGRTVLITGPTSGLGRQVTDELAGAGSARGAHGPQPGTADRAVHDALLARHGVDRFPVAVADMGSLESVRAAVDRILATE